MPFKVDKFISLVRVSGHTGPATVLLLAKAASCELSGCPRANAGLLLRSLPSVDVGFPTYCVAQKKSRPKAACSDQALST